MRLGILAALIGFLTGCTEHTPIQPGPHYHAQTNPEYLSEWGQVTRVRENLALSPGVTAYDLNTALFSDYAVKLRTVWIPDGIEPAGYQDREVFDFPVGTVITKTFYYPRAQGGSDHVARTRESMAHFEGRRLDLSAVRLIETRILVRRDNGWDALPYIWNEDQTDARLSRTGGFLDLTLISLTGETEDLSYLVPNVNQCASCHETNTEDGLGLRPIGPKTRHINRDFDYVSGTMNQLDAWHERGLLQNPPLPEGVTQAAAWSDGVPLGQLQESTARAYLDINCAHCHSRTGPADTSGLYLEPWEPIGPNLGLCKPPIAAGRGTGGRTYGLVPGDPDASILVYRMISDRADIMMPELGRSVSDREGVALISSWVDNIPGSCD